MQAYRGFESLPLRHDSYELLRPIWVEKRETANRVRGRIETIIAKNVDVDDTDFRNPAELTKQLREEHKFAGWGTYTERMRFSGN